MARPIAMKQPSLFEPDETSTALASLGVTGSRQALNKTQRRFNQLIAKIAAQRQLLQQWQDFIPVYESLFAKEMEPLIGSWRDKRSAMVYLLDNALEGRGLTKAFRAKAIDILLILVSELLSDAPDAGLRELHDKYSPRSLDAKRQDELALTKLIAGSLLNVELDEDDEKLSSPEELGERIAAKLRAAQDERAAGAAQASPKRRGKAGAKAEATEAERSRIAQGASRVLREVYRKLVSELHPDRETDLARRKAKTAQMQKVNQAYANGDLLALLELQLSIAQIDPDHLAGVAEERLAFYNRTLEEQLLRLQEAVSDLVAPFAGPSGAAPPRSLTPDQVARGLVDSAVQLRFQLRELESDLEAFEDLRHLKAYLRQHRIQSAELEGLEDFCALQRRRRGDAVAERSSWEPWAPPKKSAKSPALTARRCAADAKC